MFLPSQNVALWAFAAPLFALVYVIMRRYVRKQIAMAPEASLRSPRQRALHWASIFILWIPLGYVFFINGEHYWPTLAVLCAQVAPMIFLRLLGVRFVVRVWLIIPIAAASAIAGAVDAVWPSVDPSTLRGAPWLYLFFVALACTLSHVISIYFFPIGYGERSR